MKVRCAKMLDGKEVLRSSEEAEFAMIRYPDPLASETNDGMVQFLADCSHEYADQTLELLDIK